MFQIDQRQDKHPIASPRQEIDHSSRVPWANLVVMVPVAAAVVVVDVVVMEWVVVVVVEVVL